jgi:hypothetical protein
MQGRRNDSYHYDDTFDVVGQCLIAAFFPIARRFALLAQHHRRAMGEEVYRWQSWNQSQHWERYEHLYLGIGVWIEN